MSVFILKIIGIICMTFDHIGVHIIGLYGDGYQACRIIGRIAFPIFAFLIGEGYRHTRSVWKYLFRLVICSAAIEVVLIIFYFATGVNFILVDDIFALLALGLICIILLDNKRIWVKFLALPVIFLVVISDLDYGVYGLLIIIMLYFVRNKILLTVVFTLLNLIFIVLLPKAGFLVGTIFQQPKPTYVQWFSLLGLIPIFLYNGKLGKKWKYFFYLYYPVHLGIIIAIGYLL